MQQNPLNFAFPANITKPTPFQVSVDADFLKSTIQKVRLYRPTIALDDLPEWSEGPPPANINELARYWADDYDWSSVQAEINANFSHFTTTIPGNANYSRPVPLHFVHERAAESNDTDEEAIPLLMIHGWPSTHLEWTKVIHPLAHPENASSPRFHVVAPDIPGFGFSPAATHAGLGVRELGLIFDALMKQLGYSRYAVFSTDLGWLIGSWMTADTTSIIAHATDFFSVMPSPSDLERLAKNQTTAEETAYMMAAQEYQSNHFAYALLQGTKPLSVALAMTDSPVGFLGWVWSLVKGVSDGYEYSKEELITTAMALFVQGTYGGMRLYKDSLTVSIRSTASMLGRLLICACRSAKPSQRHRYPRVYWNLRTPMARIPSSEAFSLW
jgi:pimeloyl-ACP methyl ester carboxylesterase